jgi:hypothetical protein
MKASDESVGRSSEIGMGMGDEPDILLSEVVDGCSVDDPHLEACLSKLVKISTYDPDSDVWEDGEWEKTLQMLLEEDLLPTMPQEGF